MTGHAVYRLTDKSDKQTSERAANDRRQSRPEKWMLRASEYVCGKNPTHEANHSEEQERFDV